MTLVARIQQWGHGLRRDALALWIAARSSETPFAAKLVAAAVAAYAFSPIDLIPDFIPVIGLLDDAILIPLGIELALHLIPEELMERFRAEAEVESHTPRSWIAGAIIVAMWGLFILWLGWELLAVD